MTLNPTQLLCLRAADGELSPEETARLLAVGEDPAAWRALPDLIRDAARAPRLLPGLPEAVLSELELEDDVLLLTEALAAAGGVSPSLVDGVFEGVELSSEGMLISDLVGEALTAAAGPAPELAAGVLAQLGLSEERSVLGEALQSAAGTAPSLADSVLSEVSLAGAEHGELGGLIRESLQAGLDSGGSVDFVDAVMSRLGAAEDADLVARALDAERGPAPSLWAGVSEALQLVEEAAPELTPLHETSLGEPVVVPLAPTTRTRRWERWAMGSAMFAAAAAMLVFVTRTDPSPIPESLAAVELSPVNDLDLEDIYSEAMVQVIDGEDDSPTIIFISELIDEDLFDDDQGRL